MAGRTCVEVARFLKDFSHEKGATAIKRDSQTRPAGLSKSLANRLPPGLGNVRAAF